MFDFNHIGTYISYIKVAGAKCLEFKDYRVGYNNGSIKEIYWLDVARLNHLGFTEHWDTVTESNDLEDFKIKVANYFLNK